MNTNLSVFSEPGMMLEAMDGSIILKDGLYSVFDNSHNRLVSLPYTVGEGTLGTMHTCQYVDEQRRELGWKYRLEENGLWGWIHPQFCQILPPIFHNFHFTTEDSDCMMMAVIPGEDPHSVLGLWMLTGNWSDVRMLPLRMPSKPDGRKHFFVILNYGPVMTTTCRVKFWKDSENGQPVFGILVDTVLEANGALVTESCRFWQITANGPTACTEVSRSGKEEVFSVHRSSGGKIGKISCLRPSKKYSFACLGFPSADFFPYMRDYEGCPADKTIRTATINNGTQQAAIHVVFREEDPTLFALEYERTNSRTFDERTLLTPFVFTSVSLIHEVKHEDRDTPELYLEVAQNGKKGLLRISQHSWNHQPEYLLPCEYDSVRIVDGSIRVSRMGQEGRLSFFGRWLEKLHD